MRTIPDNKSKPPRKRNGKGNVHKEEHFILDERVKIFRVHQSGDVWQVRMWFRKSQKCYRKSLRTRNLREAKELAEELYFDLHHKEKNGEQLFEKSAKELITLYLNNRKEVDVKNRHITPERLDTIKSQLKHFLKIVGATHKDLGCDPDNIKNDNKVKLGSLDFRLLEKYENMRREYAPTVRQITLANEMSTIKNFYQWCFDNRYLSLESKPVFPKIAKRNRNEKINRDELSRSEWHSIYTYMQQWHRGYSKKEQDERYFVRYFILLLCASGLRFGEARKLRWGDWEVRKDGKDGYLRIDLKEGKTGARVIVCRRFDLYRKLKKLSKHTSKDDFIFVDNETGQPIVKDVYYRYWKEILQKTELDQLNKKIVFYCLRHTYATWSLYAGVNIYDLALNMGCSIHFIEEHYGHVKVDKKWRELVGMIEHKDLNLMLGSDKLTFDYEDHM
jgi:integrase